MILLKSIKVKIQGSRILKMRAREGGASIFTSLLFPKAAASAKRTIQRAGKKEGGWGEGIFARPLPKRSPAAPPENLQGGTEQKNFLFLLKEKNGRAQNQKMRRKFFCEVVTGASAEASGGASSLVWVLVKKSSDFVQKVPPIFKIRILGDCCLAPPKAGLGFGKDFEGIFEIQKQFLPAQTEVQFAESKHKFEKFINQSFFFRLWRKAKR